MLHRVFPSDVYLLRPQQWLSSQVRKELDMNRKLLTGKFCQTLALFITCHPTPATLCLCKAIKEISEATGAPCDTKQTPSVILYLQGNRVR